MEEKKQTKPSIQPTTECQTWKKKISWIEKKIKIKKRPHQWYKAHDCHDVNTVDADDASDDDDDNVVDDDVGNVADVVDAINCQNTYL